MRQEIINFDEISETREVVEQKIPNFFLWFFYLMLAGIIALLCWSYFGEKEIVVRSSGLVKTENTQNIVPVIAGIVDGVYFSEGDLVTEGDLIFSLNASEVEYDLETYTSMLSQYERTIELNNLLLDCISQENNLFVLTTMDEVSFYYDYEEYVLNLASEDEEDREQFENQKVAEIYSTISSTSSTILQYSSEIGKLESKLESYEYYANETGFVHFISSLQVGSTVQPGYEIARISEQLESDESYSVMLYVLNSSITKLEVGQSVRVEIPSLNAREYGYGNAVITSIESDARVDQESGNSFYVVYAELQEKEFSSDTNTESVLVGMQVEGRVIVDKQKYLFYFIEKLDLWIFG